MLWIRLLPILFCTQVSLAQLADQLLPGSSFIAKDFTMITPQTYGDENTGYEYVIRKTLIPGEVIQGEDETINANARCNLRLESKNPRFAIYASIRNQQKIFSSLKIMSVVSSYDGKDLERVTYYLSVDLMGPTWALENIAAGKLTCSVGTWGTNSLTLSDVSQIISGALTIQNNTF